MEWVQIDGKEIPLLEPPQRYENPPRRILYVLFKRKRLVILIFLMLTLPTVLYILSQPTKYAATARIMIKPSREFLSVSPTAGASVTLHPRPEVINTEMQIMRSPELAQRLAGEIPFPDDPNSHNRTEAQIDRDGRRIRGLLMASPVRATSVVNLSVTSAYPQEWAARVANRAAELYLEQHLKVHRTPGIGEFYDEQETKLRAELLQAEEELKSFQERENIIDAPQQVTAYLTSLATFERALKETDSSIRESEQRIAVLDNQLKQQQAKISTSTQINMNPVYAQIQNRITAVQLERDGLLQRYTPEHRLVKDKDKEIEELTRQLAKVSPTAVGSEHIGLNDVHRRILNELLSARVQLRSLNEKKAALTSQVESYSNIAAEKKRKSFEYDRLLRAVNTKKDNLDLYKRKAEEARISDAMDERKFSNAYILERAVLPLPRAGYSPSTLIAGTIIFALGIAIAAAFALEYLTTTVRNEADLEDEIGLPVLATIQHYGEFRPAPYSR